MVATKQLNIKNRTYYFYGDIINIKDFDPRLLKLGKRSSMDIGIYYICYVTKINSVINSINSVIILNSIISINSVNNINSVNPLYLLINELDGFIEEKEGNKYLNLSLTCNNNDVLIKYAEVWNGIKDQIKKINNGSVGEYAKDYLKIKFDFDDTLPLNKILKFCILTIIVRNIFEKDGLR